MATFHVYNDFPGAFMRHSAEYTEFWAGLINDSVSVSDTASYNYGRPNSRLSSYANLPNARWQRSGNIITLVSSDVYFAPTDYRNDGYRITHIGVFMADPSFRKTAGIGFVEKAWDFRLPADGGNGGLRLKWNPTGIVSIELVHG